MAEETDLSRTEPASSRRLQDVQRGRCAAFRRTLPGGRAATGALGWQVPRLLEATQGVTSAAFTHAAQPLSPVLVEAAEALLWAMPSVSPRLSLSQIAFPLASGVSAAEAPDAEKQAGDTVDKAAADADQIGALARRACIGIRGAGAWSHVGALTIADANLLSPELPGFDGLRHKEGCARFGFVTRC